ncbi:MAG: amidohydrolase family protein, partial [Clostridia bacterium]|nr:amidohydrolase family protein [Clostridia bacterium]
PAKRFGLNKGKIEQGYDADIVILNDDFTVSSVIIGGVIY